MAQHNRSITPGCELRCRKRYNPGPRYSPVPRMTKNG